MPPNPPKAPMRISTEPPPIKPPPIARRPTPLYKPAPRNAPPSKPPKPPHDTPPPPRRSPFTLRSTLKWGSNIIVGVCLLLWTRDHYLDWHTVYGASMAPTINPDTHETGRRDWVVITPLAYRQRGAGDDVYGALKRGDVVTLWKPHKPEEIWIKRVVGLQGDEVYPVRGYAVERVQGERLQGMPDGLADKEEGSVLEGREVRGKVVVPYGHVWLEGDNEEKSLDSRDLGPVSRSLIEARAARVWRGWGVLKGVGDGMSAKERARGSRVVEGRMDAPSVFLN